MGVEGLSDREVLFGRLAVEEGHIDDEALEKALALRRERIANGTHPVKLPSILQEEGWLSQEVFDALRRRVLGQHPKENRRRLGPYEIEKRVGRGGMGIVYRGRSEDGKVVAVKVLGNTFKDDPKLVERFVREFEAVRSIRHPNLVEGYHAGIEDGVYYYSMEFVDGESAKEFVRREKRYEIEEAVRIVRDVAEALVAIHEAGYVHRDVKSSNILVDKEGRVKLSDLGLARDNDSDAGLTRFGTGLGSAEYASPEQLQDAARIDARTDIYSLGVTLFEMLAGRTPYMGVSPATIYSKKIREPIPDVSKLRPEVPARLKDLVQSMMAKAPADRPGTPADVIRSLDAAGEPTRPAKRGSARRRRTTSIRRTDSSGTWIWFGVGLAVALVLGLAILLS